MGIAAVIFLIAAFVFAALWLKEQGKVQLCVEKYASLKLANTSLQLQAEKREADLEAEIQRLRKQPVANKPEKTDNSTIKATSPAQVRHLTEAAFGKWPAEETVNADE